MGSAHPSSLRGFTLIEVLIAFVILSFGLLGAVALQATAKKASFDSMQRAAAVALGNDIIQRIRANDVPQIGALYKKDFTSKTALNSNSQCFTGACSAAQIAALDFEQWKRAIQARENTGTLDDATVCIDPQMMANTKGKQFNIEVIISWQGRQEMTATGSTQGKKCGANDKKRRLVVINSFIYIRS
ncbi:pilus assembly protein [Pseudoalteromonas porphyrae]|uniref:Pilus assembly protein n=1 Tax=Pseudoalteromonas porphyrae TaxID=187330 RepID=A0A0N1MVQ6_9GAMM|nr:MULTISPECIES: type IV pilus modification protein PilV [Pseudoalteromonas]KPH64716.1 pilus assembly protein [Pseudoalteromonas porphyrae]KPH94574.1 pilus assembly protein [Pseudoalteromonas porphyrae]